MTPKEVYSKLFPDEQKQNSSALYPGPSTPTTSTPAERTEMLFRGGDTARLKFFLISLTF